MTNRPFNLAPDTQLELNIMDAIKVQREIGRGGLSIVYEGEFKDLEGNFPTKAVALKLFSPDERFSDFTRLRARFRLERWFTNRFIFNRLLTGWGGTVDDYDYIVLSQLCDFDLKTVIRNQERLNSEDMLAIIFDVLTGVTFLHANGVIHRDLKPNNILLIKKRALVGDFGIARDATKTTVEDTHTHDLIGSRDYIAPEQRENPRAATEQSDIYSLGVILYELIMGRLPSYMYDPIGSENPEWSFMDPIVSRMLLRLPSERYASIPEILREIAKGWTASKLSSAFHITYVQPYESLLFARQWLQEWPNISHQLTSFNYSLFQIEDLIAFFSYWVGQPYTRLLQVPIPTVTQFESLSKKILEDSRVESDLVSSYLCLVEDLFVAHKIMFIECDILTS